MKFRKQKELSVTAVQTGSRAPAFPELSPRGPFAEGERRLYAALRDAVPIIDAALGKLQRLVGGFVVRCDYQNTEYEINNFLQNVKVNSMEHGVQCFLDTYLTELLTYGNAVGEIVLDRGGQIAALYNADLNDVELRPDGPLDITVCRRGKDGGFYPVPYPELVVAGALTPPPGSAKGRSLLRGLPFASGIMLQIFDSIGRNWERMGNVRFAVTYKPGGDPGDRAYAVERAQTVAEEWSRAMSQEAPTDFVALGDVNIQAIGADNQILDSNVPVRQLLEQIVAKLGLPPFLLGLSWSSTERMSTQQADILTSELESYRRCLEPPVRKLCGLWMRLRGNGGAYQVEWDNITLQDATELANARLLNARAAQIEETLRTKN